MTSPPPKIVVIQPLPGIGDMIWHLPHIRAIAAHVGAPVTLVAKPRSTAAQLFAAEGTIRDIIWMDRNPERRRGEHDGPLGLLRLISTLRARGFDRSYLMHQSQTLAFATWAAGIPARHGYGSGTQRLWLNAPPFLSPEGLRMNWFQQATRFLADAGIPMTETEPRLPVLPEARSAVEQRLGRSDVPLVTLGIGGSERYKQWGPARFAELIGLMAPAGWTRFALLGGPRDVSIAEEILHRLGDTTVSITPALDWPLIEGAALLAASAFYVGNDTGMLNMAAAIGIRTYGVFGATTPFFHNPQIVPISPPDGIISQTDGMARITAEATFAAILADQAGLRK